MTAFAGCTDGLQRSLDEWRTCPEPPAPATPVAALLPQPVDDWIQLNKSEPPRLDAEAAIQAQYIGPFKGLHTAHVSRWPRIQVHDIRQQIRRGEIGAFDVWIWRGQYVFAARTRDSVRMLPDLLELSPALSHSCVTQQGESRTRQLPEFRPPPE